MLGKPATQVAFDRCNLLSGYMKIPENSTKAYFSDLGRIRMLAGDPALDFANTWHWREGRQVDFITGFEALVGWSVPAGLLSEKEAKALGAAERAPEAAKIHREALGLRTAWRGYLEAEVGRGSSEPSAGQERQVLEERLADALRESRLWMNSAAPRDTAGALALPKARIALAIASLLTIPAGRVIRQCEGDPCGGFFLDNSRSKPRRWCAMDVCGNRAKVRGFRSRMMAEEIR